MRATITVYGEQGSGKTNWLGQLKRALLATAPVEAVEVTVFEIHREQGTSLHVSEQFDEFTIPAADAEGSVGVAGDRETWSVAPYNDGYCVRRGTRWVATFAHRSDAELFKMMKCTTSGQWLALGAVLDRKLFTFNGDRPFFFGGPIAENCRGGGGDFAEGAGAIPLAVYWHEAAGNFINWWNDAPLSATFYKAWASRRAEFPQTRADCQMHRIIANSMFGKLSAAEAPAIHDAWPTPMVPRAERDQARRDAVELRKERDEARRERDDLKERLANVVTYLNGHKNLADALRDASVERIRAS